jgi:hypothetical protein
MTEYGLSFSATAGSQTLFSTTNWNRPGTTTFSTPLALTSGTNVSWTCSFYNPTTSTLTFGDSSQENAMCRSISFIYPIADVTNPDIGTGE